MSPNRLPDYLVHIRQAASNACNFVDGLSMDDFMADTRTQHAVTMSLIIMGEAAAKVMDNHAEFVLAHPEVPWRAMRGMRNRVAHGYFDLELQVIWATVQEALPELLRQMSALLAQADDGSAGDDH